MGFGITAAALAVLVLAAWALFDTETVTKWVPSSREARSNQYLALDRWLAERGVSARIESAGDIPMISLAGEKNVFVQASLFNWNDEAVEFLTEWIENGGNLFLVLDYQTIPGNSYLAHDETWINRQKEPFLLLEEFGITAETGNKTQEYKYDSESPGFDRDISFWVADDTNAVVLKDWTGLNRLVKVKRGKGELTVSGRPRFLYSANIGDSPNTRLAWALFNTEDEWLFIRGTTKVSGLLGRLWQEGNLPALVVSVLVLLVICFWAVLPMFGMVKEENDRPLKALRERFLAEGRFLKRYGALDMYTGKYMKEIKRRLAGKEGIADNEEIEKRVLAIWGKQGEKNALLLKALRGEKFSYNEFPRMIIIFKTILERI